MAQTALITGASGGIGHELVKLYAAEGCDLVLVARNREKLEEIAADMRATHGVQAYECAEDLSDPAATKRIVAVMEAWGLEVDILVNNAGFGYDAAFVESDLARQRALLQVNVMALMELSHEFGSLMAKRGHGAILNVASVAGFMPGPYMATYYASKAFVQSFSQALHTELGSSGVAVTALCPGPVRTEFWNTADVADASPFVHLAATPKSVAASGYRALRRDKVLCMPGIMPKILVFLMRLAPRSWVRGCVALLQYPK